MKMREKERGKKEPGHRGSSLEASREVAGVGEIGVAERIGY